MDSALPSTINCQRIRLGHAYRSAPGAGDLDDVDEILEILIGTAELTSRDPIIPTVVLRAERILNAAVRPLYSFSGCLHPKLGTIGLIIDPSCLEKRLQGVSRCDSGGLVGRLGAFTYVREEDVEGALRSLSFDDSPDWEDAFSKELSGSYNTVHSYASGDPPNHAMWDDVRAMCINSHDASVDGPLDRRLWTWEVRLKSAPTPSEFECLVISHEAFKRLEEIRQTGGREVPTSVRILRGRVSARGVHYFEDDAVVDALCGGMA